MIALFFHNLTHKHQTITGKDDSKIVLCSKRGQIESAYYCHPDGKVFLIPNSNVLRKVIEQHTAAGIMRLLHDAGTQEVKP